MTITGLPGAAPGIGEQFDEGAEALAAVDNGDLDRGCSAADGPVVDQVLTQRADSLVGHWIFLSWMRELRPSSSRQEVRGFYGLGTRKQREINPPRSFFRRSLRILPVVGLWLGFASACRADSIYYFAQVICAPEIEQFYVRPYFQYNVPTKFFEDHEDGASVLAKKHGIYTTLELRNAPFRCDIKGPGSQSVHVVVTGETPNGNGPFEHGQERLIVTVNDKEVAKIDMGLQHPLPTGYVSIEGNGLNFDATICALSGEQGKDDGMRIFVPADQGKCRVVRVK